MAYRSGQMWRSKQPDQRVVTLAMWSAGVDSLSGSPAADQRLAFNNNFQKLRSMFWTQGNLGSTLGFLTRRWYLTQNGVTGIVSATARGEIAGTMQPTMSGRTKADFSVDFLLPDPYFYGAPQTTRVLANGTANLLNLGDGAVGFGQGQGSGGVPFTIRLTGPLTGPVMLANDTGNVSVSLNASVPAGHFTTLDVLNYTAYTDAGVSVLGSVTHSGARPWMLLAPFGSSSLVNFLEFTTSNQSDSGFADVIWSPPYL